MTNRGMSEGAGFAQSRLEQRYEEYRKILKKLTIMSDIFMRNVLKEKECTEYLLRIIMQKKDLHVVEQTIQKDYKNLQGRSGILDCVARDGQDKQYDIEIQQENEGASPKRARYHSSLMDCNTLKPGQNFDELPENYVIFITRKDVLQKGLPICHIERKIRETKDDFQDGSHMIYVNSQNEEDSELGRLMHDLNCMDADEMYSEVLAKRVKELKETEEGVERMCTEMEEIYGKGELRGIAIGEARGITIGELNAKRKTARSLFEMKLPVEQIARAVSADVATVQEWLAAEK